MSDCFKQAERKARKQHKCCECHRIIEKGEKYIYESGVYENNPFGHKTCSDCMSMRFLAGEECAFGELFEDIRWYIDEVNGNVPKNVLEKLTPRAMNAIADMVKKFKEDRK